MILYIQQSRKPISLNGEDMTKLENNNYIINDYQKQKPFSSFLSGIAGKMGKPLWAFYVNRGQAIASFGVRDKNGAIMEFYPANQSYMYTGINGFRTFIKVDGIIHEFCKCQYQSEPLYWCEIEPPFNSSTSPLFL